MPTIPAPEKPLSRFAAQRQLGLFAVVDYVVATIIGCTWITTGFWALFGQPTAIGLIGVVLGTVALTQLWLILLAYRVLVFIMDLGADINLMPEAAARIVAGYWEGRAK